MRKALKVWQGCLFHRWRPFLITTRFQCFSCIYVFSGVLGEGFLSTPAMVLEVFSFSLSSEEGTWGPRFLEKGGASGTHVGMIWCHFTRPKSSKSNVEFGVRFWQDFRASPGGLGAQKSWFGFNKTHDFENRTLSFPVSFLGPFLEPKSCQKEVQNEVKNGLGFWIDFGRLEKTDF